MRLDSTEWDIFDAKMDLGLLNEIHQAFITSKQWRNHVVENLLVVSRQAALLGLAESPDMA